MMMKMELFSNGFACISKERLPLIGSLEGGEGGEESPCISLNWLLKKIKNLWNGIQDVSSKAWEMGRSDPRKIIFAMKMGLALSLVSLLIFWKEPADIGQYSIWAILTVIVMFEFSIGASHSQPIHDWISLSLVIQLLPNNCCFFLFLLLISIFFCRSNFY